MRFSLPQSLRDHLDFAEAFYELGRRLFPNAWTGKEAAPPGWETVLPAEHAALQREADEMRRRLSRMGYSNPDEYVRAVIAQNEFTGDFDSECLEDDPREPNTRPKLIARLYSLLQELDCRFEPDNPGYAELLDLRDRKQATLEVLLSLLADGRVPAFSQDGHIRAAIAPERWAKSGLDIDVSNSTVHLPGDWQRKRIVVSATEACAAFKQCAQPQSGNKKRDTQREVREELTKMMRDAPDDPRTKSAVRKELPAVPDRVFDRIWSEAIKATGAISWAKPGRRSLKPTKSQQEITA